MISWNEYFMLSAKLASQRSKDPCVKVGAVIVNEFNHIISSGYNGFPIGIPDEFLPWTKKDPDPMKNKHLYVVHAELNAILNCIGSSRNCVMYCTLYPCSECCKAIIQSGIKKVVYSKDPSFDKVTYNASRKMFDLAKIVIVKDVEDTLSNNATFAVE